MRSIRRHHSRKQFAGHLEGKKMTGVERRGKYLLVKLEGGEVLVIHLGMSGQLIRAKGTRDAMAKHTHVVITFTQGGQLRFIDPRTFGEMFVTDVKGGDDDFAVRSSSPAQGHEPFGAGKQGRRSCARSAAITAASSSRVISRARR